MSKLGHAWFCGGLLTLASAAWLASATVGEAQTVRPPTGNPQKKDTGTIKDAGTGSSSTTKKDKKDTTTKKSNSINTPPIVIPPPSTSYERVPTYVPGVGVVGMFNKVPTGTNAMLQYQNNLNQQYTAQLLYSSLLNPYNQLAINPYNSLYASPYNSVYANPYNSLNVNPYAQSLYNPLMQPYPGSLQQFTQQPFMPGSYSPYQTYNPYDPLNSYNPNYRQPVLPYSNPFGTWGGLGSGLGGIR